MADQHNNNDNNDLNTPGGQRPEDHPEHSLHPQQGADVPIEEEVVEDDHPRRAASAEFIVKSEVASEVALREAMDPANQSLAEALRLSYRILQVVIVILIILFFASGFQTVESTQSGVFTRFGKIIPVDDSEALTPGPKLTIWPYPVGEYILFDVQDRSVSVGDIFWPGMRPGHDLEQATQAARTSDFIQPGRDGALLTAGGDLAHVHLDAKYEIIDPVLFVHNMPTDSQQVNEIVRLTLERATVQVAAKLTLEQLVNVTDETRYQIRLAAQEMLNDLNSGIELRIINIPDAIPPLAIRKIYGELQNAIFEAQNRKQTARQNAERTLVAVAGQNNDRLIELVEQYQRALDADREDDAEQYLEQLREVLSTSEIKGEASQIIARAEAYSSHIDQALGGEARRFESLLPSYRENPELLVRQQWLQAYADVLAQPDTEIFSVPMSLNRMRIAIGGSEDVAELRRQNRLDFKESGTAQGAFRGFRDYGIPGSSLMPMDAPGRRVRPGEDGGVVNVRSGN